MAHRKDTGPSLLEFLGRSDNEFQETHPIIKSEYMVVEVTPSSEDDYGSYVPARYGNRTPYQSLKECQKYLDEYAPSKYNHFEIHARHLRHVPATTQWFNY